MQVHERLQRKGQQREGEARMRVQLAQAARGGVELLEYQVDRQQDLADYVRGDHLRVVQHLQKGRVLVVLLQECKHLSIDFLQVCALDY